MGVAAAGLALAGVAGADEPPLLLSDRHVGMTGDDIAAEEAAVKAERVELALAAEPEENEWVDASPGTENARAEAAPAPETAPEACPAVAPAGAAPTTFESCVETSIRAGNAFGESSRVCRAVFAKATAGE